MASSSAAGSPQKAGTPLASGSADQAAAAAASLQLLLREDPRLVEMGLTEPATASGKSSLNQEEEAAFPYAAALLQQNDGDDTTTGGTTTSTTKQRADLALQDVERKLALVESLAVKLSRTSPEAVAGHLLRLHGYQVAAAAGAGVSSSEPSSSAADDPDTSTTTTTTTLSAVRDRANRLERQSAVLEGVAQRVEGSLQRGLDRMNAACTKLQRVLQLSVTLKQILRSQFELKQGRDYDLSDWRDLTRAAASVAVLEQVLLLQPQDDDKKDDENDDDEKIGLVEQLRPQATQMAADVRRAAAALLERHFFVNPAAANNVQPLGATLQVYFHLSELPQAVYRALDMAHAQAVQASRAFWDTTSSSSSSTLTTLTLEHARKATVSSSSGKDATNVAAQKLVQWRLEAAEAWSQKVLAATTAVQNLQRVLQRKTDPESRQVFWHVVAQAPVPQEYQKPPPAKSATPATTGTAAATLGSPMSKQQQQQQPFSLVRLFWERYCRSLAKVLQQVLQQDAWVATVAALYPAVRRVAKTLIGQLHEGGNRSASSSTSSLWLYDAASSSDAAASLTTGAGILGGSRALAVAMENPQSGAGGTTSYRGGPSADTWTQVAATPLASSTTTTSGTTTTTTTTTSSSSSSDAIVFQSSEWKTLMSNDQDQSGLFPLQHAFVQACTERLCQPLQYMFPENVALDADGVPLPGTASKNLALLPSKYDVQRFDENIRRELALADPKEGGGEWTAVALIAACVVDMISQFCARARHAMSGAHADQYLTAGGDDDTTDNNNWTMTDSLQHDRKVAAIMYTLQMYLRSGPEKTFVAPYRPATSPQQEEAAALCLSALQPAMDNIDAVVTGVILEPLCQACNRRLGHLLARMHWGVYMDSSGSTSEEDPADSSTTTAFVQTQLAPVYQTISTQILAKFPPPYASFVAANIAAFSIYAFCSNAALVRPLGEAARLHLTQDLADLELALEQLVMIKSSSGNNNNAATGGHALLQHLSHIDQGKPYAELRAVRQMLFWNGLSASSSKTGPDLAKALLREAWVRDLRPSTVLHYLFTFAPSLLSSPHHVKRCTAPDYVFGNNNNNENGGLVHYNGTCGTDGSGEEDAWMVTLACCDLYAQRATAAAEHDGDARVAALLTSLGPELLRRRRH